MLLRLDFTDLSVQRRLLMLSLTVLRESKFLTEQKSRDHLVSRFGLMLLQHLREQSLMLFLYSAVVTVLVQRIQHLLRSLQHSITQRRRDLLSVSMMMLHIFHLIRDLLLLQHLRELQTVSSGDSVLTVL